MSITFSSQLSPFRLRDRKKIQDWITQVVIREGKRVGKIAYLFCDDEYILQANRNFLQHDTYTDIITFDYVEGDYISGDILVSVERVRDNAKKFKVSSREELLRVIIHGVLHLLGQGDKSEAEAAQMRRKEDSALCLWHLMEGDVSQETSV